MNLPTNFCVAPFIQHTTHPSGSNSPCPYLGGTTWAGGGESILEQWSSSKLEQLRQDFKDNKKSYICKRCWNEEDNHKRSLRLRLFDPVTHTSDYSFATPKLIEQRITNNRYLSAGPAVLTIKNGNVCNAKCRSCHPNDSSKWSGDAEKLHALTKERIYFNLHNKEINWSDTQVDEIVKLSNNLVRLELFGGEPTYNKRVATILNRLVELGTAKNITLYINTNGSVNIPKRLPMVTEFRDIELGVSLDGVGDQFNYIRHGSIYNEVIDNILSTQQFFKENNIKYWIDSISTVSVLNVFYLPELKQAVRKILPLDPFWNLLFDPAHLYIRNMPDQVKQEVITKLGDAEDFKELISIMQQPADPIRWKQFLQITEHLDSYRNENFALTFPEFYNIIQKYEIKVS
jgi:MoaA/NifB/PqqE/SkfB family radical SAM enzyme